MSDELNMIEQFMYAFRRERIADHRANHPIYYAIPEGLVEKIRKDKSLRQIIKDILIAKIDVGDFFYKGPIRDSNLRIGLIQIDCFDLHQFNTAPLDIDTNIDGYKLHLDHVNIVVYGPHKDMYTTFNVFPDKTAKIGTIHGIAANSEKVRKAFLRCGIETILGLE